MLIIGLTGGIGCGKTTVTQLFQQRNVPVVDADEIAHAVVQPKQPALTAVAAAFGPQVISADGSLDRDQLRNIVFTDPTKKKILEDILHPIIFKTMYQQLEQYDAAYGIASIPLLFEGNKPHNFARVLVIDCPETLQIQRVKTRDQLSDNIISSIMDSQCSRSYRLAHADDIIRNDGSLDSLETQVAQRHAEYLSMSAG
ncbi:dephospho-CoA kinase [Cycloclasticus sp. 46_83_sub15_T18]|nr:dephospho-CoA kinase [Cycloclasticus sp. 46_83_sub15_T18]